MHTKSKPGKNFLALSDRGYDPELKKEKRKMNKRFFIGIAFLTLLLLSICSVFTPLAKAESLSINGSEPLQSDDSLVETLSSSIQDASTVNTSSSSPPSDFLVEDSSSSSSASTAPSDSADSMSTPVDAELTGSSVEEISRWDNAWTYTVGSGNNTCTSTIYSSPQVFWNGSCWLNSTYEEHADYRLMRNSRVTVEVYDYYAKYYDVNYSEVRLYDERFEVQRWMPKQERWDDLGAQSGSPVYAVVTNASGVWLTKSFTSWAGNLSITYTLRVAQPLKTTITWKSLLTEETEFRIVMKWSGIAGEKVNTNQGTMNVTAPITFNSTLYTFMKQDDTITIQESLADTGFIDENRVYRNYVLQPVTVDVDAQGMKCDYVFQNSTLYSVPQNGIIVVDPTTWVDAESDRTGSIYAGNPTWPPGDPDMVLTGSVMIGQFKGGMYELYRGYVSFNTANLENDVVILSSKLYLYTQYNHADTPFYLQVWGGSQGTEGLYGDLDLYAWGEGESVVGSFYIDLNLGCYADISITDLNQINKVGRTQFELRTSREGTQPTGYEYVGFYSGTTSSLSVTWKVPEVTVTGQIRYYEEDGSTLRNCRQITVKLWEEDQGFPYYELLGTTQTNDNGVYSFGPLVNRDSGQIGQQLDLFIVIWAEIPGVLRVCSGLPIIDLSETYNKESQTSWNVYGDMWFINYDITGTTRAAWGIADAVYNGHSFALGLGYDHPFVIYEWRDGLTGTSYTHSLFPDWITIVDSDRWAEDTILHEYGHSVQYYVYGDWIIWQFGEHLPYDHTSPEFAFQEGWPTFFAVAANFEKGYGDQLYPRDSKKGGMDLEDWWGIDQLDYRDVEGGVFSILWDIYDNNIDGTWWMHNHGDRVFESLAAGMTPIWTVFYNDKPDNIIDFWNDWATRYGSTQTICLIYYNYYIDMDTTAPTNPNSWSGSHSINVWSNDNTTYVQWSGAYDALSGIKGYYLAWDNSPSTVPGQSYYFTYDNYNTSYTLSDGTWYIHIRAEDWTDGMANGAYHVGPFKIDATSPTVSITYPPSDATVGGTITITATASDNLCGVNRVEFYVDTTLIGTDTTAPYEMSWNTATFANGQHTVIARAYDNANNWAQDSHNVIVYNKASCPFLYVWDGNKYVMVTDVLTPAGLAYPDISLRYGFRPPNPQDFAVIPGEALQAENGYYMIQLAELASEISYIDAIRLIAVDHPVGYTFYSPTVTTQIPLPFQYRTVYNPTSPVTATKYDYYWSQLVATTDVLNAILTPDDLNYAVANVNESHTIELNFGDLGNLNGISEFKLIVKGWMTFGDDPIGDVLWMQQHPETACAPYIEVINAQGEWEAVGEPICNESFWEGHGYPRTMMRDIRQWLMSSDYRIRLHYWGGFQLDWIAVDTTPTPYAETTFHILNPTIANLYYKGGVEFVPVEGDVLGQYPHLPDWYIPYNYDTELFTGYFTRYGNVKPLLLASDDMFVIMNYGDSVYLAFPAVPVPPSMQRDYYFYVDGYFKLPYVKYFLNNTVSTVYPLPFHDMTTYPYPENEHYPTDLIHQLYLRFWNTRYIGAEEGMELGGFNPQISIATNEKTSQLDQMLANMILADQKTAGNTVNTQT